MVHARYRRGPTGLVQLSDDAQSWQLPRQLLRHRITICIFFSFLVLPCAPWAPSISPLPCYPAAHHCNVVFPRIVQSWVLFASAGLLEVCPAIPFLGEWSRFAAIFHCGFYISRRDSGTPPFLVVYVLQMWRMLCSYNVIEFQHVNGSKRHARYRYSYTLYI